MTLPRGNFIANISVYSDKKSRPNEFGMLTGRDLSRSVCDSLCLKEYGSRVPKLSPVVSFRNQRHKMHGCSVITKYLFVC